MWPKRPSSCPAVVGSRSRPTSRCWRSWPPLSRDAPRSAHRAPWSMRGGAPTRIRWDRRARPGDRMELDVLIVGAGPAGLACAIELARLAQREHTDVNIGVLEKAEALGEHCLSGAVVNPRAFRELFPDLRDADFPFRGPVTKERVAFLTSRRAFTLPTPPTMHNAGNYVASLCEIVRWLGERAMAPGVNVFTGFPAARLLGAGRRVAGVRPAATGLDR